MAKLRGSISTVEFKKVDKSPERLLWKAVLLEAAKDALKTYNSSGWITRSDRNLARHWFLFPNVEFYRVCEMAGYEAHFVKKKMVKKINKIIEEEKACIS